MEGTLSLEYVEAKQLEYETCKEFLKNKYDNYFVSTLMVEYDEDNSKYFTLCVWTDFMPIVMPESEYVVIMALEDEKKFISYSLKQSKLFEILGDRVKESNDPVRHFIIEEPFDVELIDKIVSNCEFFKEGENSSIIPYWASGFNFNDFEEFCSLIYEYFYQKKIDIEFDQENGDVYITDKKLLKKYNQIEISMHLDNIAQLSLQIPKEEWMAEIFYHFENLLNTYKNLDKLKKKLSNFNKAKDNLAVRIYPKGAAEASNIIDRIVVDNTRQEIEATLVFDLQDSMVNVEKDVSSNWNKGESDLFKIGLMNILKKYPYEFKEMQLENGEQIYFISDTNTYIASYFLMDDFWQNILNGKDAFIGIPTSEIFWVFPLINPDKVEESKELLQTLNYDLFEKGPYSITDKIYLYKDNKLVPY